MSEHKQLVLFGSPGTGKSYSIAHEVLEEVGAEDHYIRTVFHPDYSYGDFMGKLMPRTIGGEVTYKFYAGHFLKAIAKAHKAILEKEDDEKPQNVALIIDEINRGNSAAIFGTAFQLLDRGAEGWSEYPVSLSDLEFETLLDLMDIEKGTKVRGGRERDVFYYDGGDYTQSQIETLYEDTFGTDYGRVRLPPNLSLLATMNTSDNSIYYMDSAFKRRWSWQFVDINGDKIQSNDVLFSDRSDWINFVDKLNGFIRQQHQSVRKVEDKQIGYWFIVDAPITKAQVQNKVMFFLWDGVFSTHREPLADLLGVSRNGLVTFGDFSSRVDGFVNSILSR